MGMVRILSSEDEVLDYIRENVMLDMLDYLPSGKLGYVVLYRPKLKRKESDIMKILRARHKIF